jgi:hypothetical protein
VEATKAEAASEISERNKRSVTKKSDFSRTTFTFS